MMKYEPHPPVKQVCQLMSTIQTSERLDIQASLMSRDQERGGEWWFFVVGTSFSYAFSVVY